MSIAAIAWAFKQSVGNPLRKLILVKLADNANDDGYAWPSIDRIARETETSKNSVIRHISALEQLGLLTTIRRKKENVNLPNHYQLNINGGVVPQRDYPSQRATTGIRERGGVVSECNPNRYIEPSITTTTTKASVVVPSSGRKKDNDPSKSVSPPARTDAETVEGIVAATVGTPLEGMIPESVIPTLTRDYNPDVHPDYEGETAHEGIIRIIRWTAAQMSDPKATQISNPVAFLRARAKKGMDKPAPVVRAEQEAEAERQKALNRRKERERLEKLKKEREIPPEARAQLNRLLGKAESAV